ncbi:Protein of unknown function (DUF3347) [Belliella baltica DSM 15883]|uniref:DUF3347 domain-containing protein n=1 Tax=Belliella baltica (strain DSM 15883 / CIP 108006 / LMG 21964 / BA134) TaxID=866536 RepID=I3Z5V4_BELBD|nr:DUF3347 domain-containing protein [Belliella baltica]AFL84622.1 Protein of unknown function (DUF3347) [Belliella baltica DSM 15883]
MKTKIFFAAIIAFAMVSCNSNNSSQNNGEETEVTGHEEHEHQGGHDHNDGHSHGNASGKHSDEGVATEEQQENITVERSDVTAGIINAYLGIKDALANDNQQAAAKAGTQLAESAGAFNINTFSTEQQKEIKEILDVAKEHGEHISKSEIDHQREHFETLTTDIKDLLKIAGADRNLYVQYCPMYNNKRGGSWLSASNEVKNPLFGSKMLKCGKVQQEITVE